MNDVAINKSNIPATIEDLSEFVLIGRDRLTAVRAAIRAMDKVGVASEVYQQKLNEAHEISEVVLDAEVRLGQLRKQVPKEKNQHTKSAHDNVVASTETPLQSFDKNARISAKDGQRFEALASHPEIVAKAKEQARANGEIVTRQSVLKEIKKEQKAEEIAKAKESITAQTKANTCKPMLYLGDSLEYHTRQQVDLLLTDPPYSTDVDNITVFVYDWLPSALENVKDTGSAYIFVGAYPDELKAYLNLSLPEHIRLTQILCWTYKNTLGNSPKYKYKQNYQAVLYYRGVNAPELDCPLTNEQWAVQEVNAPDGRVGDRYHTWQKPMELAERFIRHSTKPGMTVYDPFACTGTFLLAASKLGRESIGIEKDMDNARIAFERGCVNAGRI